MGFQKTNNNNGKKFVKKEKPKTFTITYPMDMSGTQGDRQYDTETLVALLKSVPWEKISFPISCAKDLVFEDQNKTGTTNVGYVNSVEAKESKEGTEVYLTCTIFPKNVPSIEKLTCPYVWPKVRTNRSGEVEVIISFEIMNDDSSATSSTEETQNN